jgi:malate dehydrogenase
MNKIALIGSGNIGGTLAHMIALKKLGDIVLLDRTSFVAQGKALDIMQSLAVTGNSCNIIGTSEYEDIVDSDIIIITAGVPRKPNMSRDDLLNINAEVMATVGAGVKKYAPNAFVIVVTNPLDAMVYAFQKYSGMPVEKVVGMAGVLDSARFKHFLSKSLRVSESDIQTMVLGGHGDTMVPLIECTTIGGIPLKYFIKEGLIIQSELDAIIQRTRDGGAEIVKLLQTGSAYYTPATAAITMMEAYLFNENRLLPSCAYLSGQYGYRDLFVGVPTIINREGVAQILEIPLSDSEKFAFNKSVLAVKDLIENLKF